MSRDPDRPDAGLRALVGAGPSQVGINGALRARDVSRPTPEDEAAARDWDARRAGGGNKGSRAG
ncbi:MAG TPA: hypothetical protein VGN54_03600 [Mycobacteriales bacterium]|nr:hypothetical protein [Mycobacteriales bacterium]